MSLSADTKDVLAADATDVSRADTTHVLPADNPGLLPLTRRPSAGPGPDCDFGKPPTPL